MASLLPSSLPFLGAGLGYRRAVTDLPQRRPGLLGFWEVMPEHHLEGGAAARAGIEAACRGIPVVTHSVSLSVGSADGHDEGFLGAAAAVSRRLGARWTSDHLCFTKAGGRSIGQLTPIPLTDEALAVAVRNVRRVQAAMPAPFLVENISQYFGYGGHGMQETAFLAELCRKTGCGLLLDVTNLRNNARNLGVDPRRYLDRYPMERLVQIHLAGVQRVGRWLLDTHGAPVHEEAWRLAQEAVAASDVRALLIERDQTFGPPEQLLGELARAQRLMGKARGAASAPRLTLGAPPAGLASRPLRTAGATSARRGKAKSTRRRSPEALRRPGGPRP